MSPYLLINRSVEDPLDCVDSLVNYTLSLENSHTVETPNDIHTEFNVRV